MIDSMVPPATAHRPAALVPTQARIPLAVIAVLAAAIVVWLGGLFAGTSGPSAADSAVAAALQYVGLHQGNWSDLVTSLGEPLTVIVVAALVATVALWRRRDLRLAALAVMGPGITGIVTTLAKPLAGRRLPDGSLSFPSGHTAGITGICLLLGVALVVAQGARRAVLLAIAVVTVAMAGLVGAGLVAEHAHYATDVLGGFCVAVATTAVSALVIDALTARVLIETSSTRPTVG